MRTNIQKFFMIAVLPLLGLPFMAGAMTGGRARTVTARSPDHHLEMKMTISKGKLRYGVSAGSNVLISGSSMGLDFGQAGIIPSGSWKVDKVVKRTVDKIWKPVWGKSSTVDDQYNETTITLHGSGAPFNQFCIVIRAYNDGVAFRYEIPHSATGGEIICKKELTTFNFTGDDTAWFYNGEEHNLGPDKLTAVAGNRQPVMTIKARDDAYMAILEADLQSGSPVVLNSRKGETAFSIVSAPGAVKPGYVSSWRVILYGENPGALVDAHVIQLLNPPPPSGTDFSWVKPGLALWDWRMNGAVVNGFEYKMSYPSWVRMVDFASKSGIPYLLLDAGWYGPEFKKESDPFKGGKVDEVKELIAYAKPKGVKIWLYLNDIAGRNYPLEEILKQFGEWGAAGIKYGFMRGSMAEKNVRTRLITKLCAKYHLMCDFHDGPVIPYGQMRTWPNAVTREYCQAQLDAHRVFQPKTFVTSVFVNMLAGPLDMNNGIFGLQTNRVDNPEEAPSTLVSEAARTLIVFSGATIIPDIPENYRKYPDVFSFIAAEKMPWKRSKTLMGEIGKYIVMARQASDGTWLVGAATDESARELNIPLRFLGKGNYEATIIQDGDDAHYLTNRTAHKINKKTVHSSDDVHVRLAPGGGACLIIKKE
ncbi:MAG TPA: glycoside hydrolase family 97 catalytic domain-containing protein [Chitinophagaceae bacterium]|nr:glycoside hydrolase family 97 catalytic domain-containing protein [Chitinophagaceae bacterium]